MLTVESLMEDAESLQTGSRPAHVSPGDSAQTLLAKAVWLEKSGRGSASFIGYVVDALMPKFKKGDMITIPRGTVIRGTFPDSQKTGTDDEGRPIRLAGRTYKVAVHDLYAGHMRGDWPHKTNGIGYHVSNPSVCFVGAGGYWCHVDLNDIPEAVAYCEDQMKIISSEETPSSTPEAFDILSR